VDSIWVYFPALILGLCAIRIVVHFLERGESDDASTGGKS
jgi:hypothetical protein